VRRARGVLAMEKRQQQGHPVTPVVVKGRVIAETFWGKSWCQNLERYSDFANRLPRGRTYARNGSLLDVHVAPGVISAHVAGSNLYTVEIAIAKLPRARWRAVIAACSGRIGSLIALLAGELSDEVLAVITDAKQGLFPAPHEITMACSCPDWAGMCKHVAATLYGVGARLDERPELFFTLRQVAHAELVASAGAADVLAAAGARKQGTARKRIAAGDLEAVFGIELGGEAVAPADRRRRLRAKTPGSPR
jgi:uncharacterized Zn finger protein